MNPPIGRVTFVPAGKYLLIARTVDCTCVVKARAEGPGIEFLDYLAPRDNRPYPVDARANDLFHWQTTLIFNNTSALAQCVCFADNYEFVSSAAAVAIPESKLDFKKGFLVRDRMGT